MERKDEAEQTKHKRVFKKNKVSKQGEEVNQANICFFYQLLHYSINMNTRKTA